MSELYIISIIVAVNVLVAVAILISDRLSTGSDENKYINIWNNLPAS
jgi:hypothetical protein